MFFIYLQVGTPGFLLKCLNMAQKQDATVVIKNITQQRDLFFASHPFLLRARNH